ncbi:MAG: polysaccharide biosynthesis C-terminal domain-containing protein, partial [Gammaproteobacteria bacterium]|nr:polysaccharide biosynthesis C-terminal domain-containing protein [Gammaproteobacteria bacterium]
GLPAAVGLVILAGPLMATLFQSEVFGSGDVDMAQRSLMAYAVGLQAFLLIKVLAPGYYARQDTRTPVRIGVIAMAANMVLNLALIFPLQHAGLALATSLAAYLNAYLLLRGLLRDGAFDPARGWAVLLLRVGVAVAGMAVVLLWWLPALDWWVVAPRLERVVWLLGLIVVAMLVYFVLLLAVGIRPRDLREAEEG